MREIFDEYCRDFERQRQEEASKQRPGAKKLQSSTTSSHAAEQALAAVGGPGGGGAAADAASSSSSSGGVARPDQASSDKQWAALETLMDKVGAAKHRGCWRNILAAAGSSQPASQTLAMRVDWSEMCACIGMRVHMADCEPALVVAYNKTRLTISRARMCMHAGRGTSLALLATVTASTHDSSPNSCAHGACAVAVPHCR